MVTKINNPTKKYIYFNKSTGKIHDNLLDVLNIDLVKNADLKAHEYNISNFFCRPDRYKEVVDGIYPIPPRSIGSKMIRKRQIMEKQFNERKPAQFP